VIIGIDSMILIYAGIVPSKSTKRCDDFGDLQLRSKLLLYLAARKNDTILLPTVAISELLVQFPGASKEPLSRFCNACSFVRPSIFRPLASPPT